MDGLPQFRWNHLMPATPNGAFAQNNVLLSYKYAAQSPVEFPHEWGEAVCYSAFDTDIPE